MLAYDLAVIAGRAFADQNFNNVFDVGEPPLVNVTMKLYRDSNNNGSFDSGIDTQVPGGQTTTDASGFYRFASTSVSSGTLSPGTLTAGTYFIEQLAAAGFANTQIGTAIVSANVEPSSSSRLDNLAGLAQDVAVIDEFNDADQSLTVNIGQRTASDSKTANATGGTSIIGDERDVSTTFTGFGVGDSDIRINQSGTGQLRSSDAGANSLSTTLQYDGIDGDPITLSPQGLGGIDLVRGNASAGIRIIHGADKLGGNITVTVFSSATAASSFSTGIPSTPLANLEDVFFPFSSFTPLPGALVAADFNNVGAIQVTINGTTAYQYRSSLIRSVAASEAIVNVANTPLVDLQITKTDSPDPTTPNGQIVYTLTARNNGPSAATNVVVTDVLPAGVSFTNAIASQGIQSFNSGTRTLTANLGNLAVNGTATVTITVDVDANTVGNIQNVASIRSAETDQNQTDNTANATTTVNPRVDVRVLKAGSAANAIAGGTFTYTLTVSNAGPSAATGVVVTDVLPTGTTFVNGTAANGSTVTNNGQSVRAAIGNLASGGTTTVTINVNVAGTATGNLVNTATITRTETDLDPTNDTATLTTPITRQVDIGVTKTSNPSSVIPGQQVTYTLNVTNNGPSDATGVIATDTLPVGVTFVSGTFNGVPVTNNSGVVTANIGNLARNTTSTITIIGTVASSVTTELVNNVTTTQNETDSNAANNTAQVTTQVAPPLYDLVITNTDAPDPATPGSTLAYTLTVTNTGPSDATGVTVTDVLPAGVTFTNGTSTGGGTVSSNGQTVTVNLGTLAPNASRTITINTTIAGAQRGTLTNTATVTATNASTQETNVTNNSATQTTTLSPLAELSITKTTSSFVAVVGQSLTYTITVLNSGPSFADNVRLSDDLPTQLTFVSAALSNGVIPFANGNAISALIPSLGPGLANAVTMTIVTSVQASNVSFISNQASVSTTVPEVITSNNLVTHVTPYDNAGLQDVSIKQTTSQSIADPGQPLTYLLDITNNSGTSVTGVRINFTGSNDAPINSVVLPNGEIIPLQSSQFQFDLGTLTAGESKSLALNTIVSINAVSAITNSATVEVSGVDANPGNNSTGTSLPTQLILGFGTRGIVAVDFDRDNDTDLAVVNEFSNDLVLLSNSANTGLFDVQKRVTLSGRPRSIISASDSAGPLIAIADAGASAGTGALFIYQNDSLKKVPIGSGPLDVVSGFFNEDSVADFAVVTFRSSTLEVLLGGTATPISISNERSPVAIDAVDFDTDGHLDLIVASNGYSSESTGSLSIYRGDGKGGFTPHAVLNIPKSVTDLVTVDLDASAPDEIVAVTESGEILVYSYRAASSEKLALEQRIVTNSGRSAVHLADVNQDLRDELLITDIDRGVISVYAVDSASQLALGAEITNISNPSDATTSDFDGDGKLEMIVPSYFVNSVRPLSPVQYSYASIGTKFEFDLHASPPAIKSQRITTPGIGVTEQSASNSINPILINPITASALSFDVDGDQQLTPLDALLVINSIGLTSLASGESSAVELKLDRYDLNGDNNVTPLDALLILNRLNLLYFRNGNASAEPTLQLSRELDPILSDQYFDSI